MAQTIQIANATYPDVPLIVCNKQGGGTAVFADPSGTTAAASDVAQGKLFLDALGVLTQGTASGGGNLEYETGTFTPAEDINRGSISFKKSHDYGPTFIFLWDETTPSSTFSQNSIGSFAYVDFLRLNGSGYIYSASSVRGSMAYFSYRGSSNISSTALSIQYDSDDTRSNASQYARYWATKSDFHPYANSSSRYFRAGRSYKWLAIWYQMP